MSLKIALEEILELGAVGHIQEPSDIVTDDDTQLMFNVLDNLRRLTENLNELDQPNLNLFSKDFYQIFVELIDIAQKRFLNAEGDPAWTDFRPTNIGTFLLSVIAANLDKHYYLTDRQFQQMFLLTMTQMKYFYLRAAEEAFQPLLRQAARVTIRFTIGSPRVNSVVFPVGLRLSTENSSLIFEIEDQGSIPPGALSVSAVARNWQSGTQAGFMTGTPNFEVELTQSNVLDEDHIVIIAADLWTRVPNFFNSNAAAKHYVVEFLDDERAKYIFGDGVNGAIPTGAATFKYKFGGGAQGNLAQRGMINQLADQVFDSGGGAVNDISVTNVTVPAGGSDRPGMPLQVQSLIRSKKQLTRTVTIEDFEDNVMEIPGIDRVLALDRTQEIFYGLTPSIVRGTIVLYIVPSPDTLFGPELVATIENYLLDPINGRPRMHDKVLSIVEANYQDVVVSGMVSIRRGFNLGVITTIQQTIRNMFDARSLDRNLRFTMNWGVKKPLIALSTLHDAVMRFDQQGVIRVDFTAPVQNISVSPGVFPRLLDVGGLAIQEVDDVG